MGTPLLNKMRSDVGNTKIPNFGFIGNKFLTKIDRKFRINKFRFTRHRSDIHRKFRINKFRFARHRSDQTTTLKWHRFLVAPSCLLATRSSPNQQSRIGPCNRGSALTSTVSSNYLKDSKQHKSFDSNGLTHGSQTAQG